MSFALRGAPCGNDSRLGAALGRYHNEQSSLYGFTDHHEPRPFPRVIKIGSIPPKRIVVNGIALFKGHPVLPKVFLRLARVPGIPARHRRTVESGPYLAVTS
jgi:hypothetical protein